MSDARPAAPVDRARVHLWLAAVAIATVPWLIAPGKVQPDTKVDLTISPWRYLGRALSAWNDHAGLGELQNQAYGYLFPMGPVMGVAESVGLPAWAAQRLWWTVLLVVAFLGTERLVRRLRLAGPGVALVAGAAYALSSRVLTVLSEISAEAWPLAVAPWLVLAVIPAVQEGADRRVRIRAAAVSGLLTAALGGVNATASAVVLLLPLLYLLTAARGGRARAIAWWSGGVALGALWWVLPLLVLGRYAYPFLDFIETSRITTAVTSVPNSMRGASHWVAYILDSESHPVWQAGWVQAQDPVAIVTTSLVAGLGAAGLVTLRRRGSGHVARFALVAVVLGTMLMVVGHPGTAGGAFARTVQSWLDGPLAPLRNVHKADPVLRLPLVLGVAVLLGRWTPRRTTLARLGVIGTAAVLLISATSLWVGRAGDAAAYGQVPASWRQLAKTIDREADAHGGATLLMPASRNAHYTWGSATDEPLSALATSPVVVRASAPLGDPASTRVLDVADQLAASGVRQPGLAAGLARMGLARVVVRHDLAASVGAEPWRLVEQTLSRSPGFTRVGASAGQSLWRVVGAAGGVTAYDARSELSVRGGPESIFGLAATGALDPAAWTSIATGASNAVVSDSLRWRAYNNGRTTATAYGPTLTASDRAPEEAGSRDLPPAGDPSRQTTRELVGLRALEASSSAADPFAQAYIGPGSGPAAAIDGDPATSWISDQGERARLTLLLTEPGPVGTIRLRTATGPGVSTPAQVRITTVSAGRTTTRLAPVRDAVAEVAVPGDRIDEVRVDLVAGGKDQQLGLAEISLSAQAIGSRLHLPGEVDPTTQQVLMARDSLQRSAAARVGEDSATLTRAMSIARTGSVSPSVSLRPVWGNGLDSLLDGTARVAGSSRVDLDPSGRPGATLDADPATHWRPAADDPLPTLTIDLGRPTSISGVHASGGGSLRAVRVTADNRTTRLPASGGPIALRAQRLTIGLVPGTRGQGWVAPDITIDGYTPVTTSSVTMRCGQAGSLTASGSSPTTVPLSAQTTRQALLRGEPLAARPCGQGLLTLPAGEVTVSASAGRGVQAESVLLSPTQHATSAVASPRRVVETKQDAGLHVVEVAAGSPAVLTLTEGANAGWQATTSDGRRLEAVTVDGWRQGFRLPDTGATTVRVEFAPTTAHRRGLLVGLGGVLALVAALVLTRRARPTDRMPAPRMAGSAAAYLGWAASAGTVLIGVLAAGWPGAAVGVVALLVPRRWIAVAAAAAMGCAGIVMATLGVVEQQSVGAVAGQLCGTLTLALLARALWLGAPRPGPGAPRAEPTATRLPR
ncbi:alpha-(1-_3)-arabinofuranosyltransferase domain-containing protein [Luteipulveratus mongoliensis]|uniref:F5/8 type C domain-containing protein n=1 Tax=Luteipulveratus mongoliensis TaxID=571913 RepID=A0A0K1JJ98_9MICO|nr:alpha-(1->3)-arabinofuranosyltransferase family protein [Luteipulveratus mongoliensis]AKU16782.1 hypothetical protein VV02_14400 [Luteipulveratus mongoliensis]